MAIMRKSLHPLRFQASEPSRERGVGRRVRAVLRVTLVLLSLTVIPTATATTAPIRMGPVGPFAGFTLLPGFSFLLRRASRCRPALQGPEVGGVARGQDARLEASGEIRLTSRGELTFGARVGALPPPLGSFGPSGEIPAADRHLGNIERTGDGRLLPDHLKAQVRRELDRLELLLKQIKAVEAERDALLAEQQVAAPASMLLDIKGIGPEFAAILWSEGLCRHFDNRRQVASYAGLAPTPWQSGSVDHEQGVSKAGNPRLRTTLIQLAWLWLRHQPQSALALWFEERVRRNGGRLKKTTIVALARKLLVALWKYVTAGVVIEGAVMKRT